MTAEFRLPNERQCLQSISRVFSDRSRWEIWPAAAEYSRRCDGHFLSSQLNSLGFHFWGFHRNDNLRIWVSTPVPGSHGNSQSLGQETSHLVAKLCSLVMLSKDDWCAGEKLACMRAESHFCVVHTGFVLLCEMMITSAIYFLWCIHFITPQPPNHWRPAKMVSKRSNWNCAN